MGEIFLDKLKYHLPTQAHVDVSYQKKIPSKKVSFSWVQITCEMTLGFQIKLFQQSLCMDSKHEEII